MSSENILYILLIGAGLFIAIIAAYFIFKVLRIILIKLLEVTGYFAKILFKSVYLLFMLAISAVGLIGIGAFVESVIQHKTLHLWGLGVGSVLLFLGSSGFVNFIKNGFSFDKVGITQSHYSPLSHSGTTDYGGYDPEEQRHREMDEIYAKLQADRDAELEAKYAREAQERDEWETEQARIARENWEAKMDADREIMQKANDDFWRRQEEAEAYNRQVMEDWKRQEEANEEYNRKVREERGW